MWECICECGKHTIVSSGALKSGNTKSCGCYERELLDERNKNAGTHKQTNTRFYQIWRHVKQRCNNKNDTHYNDYGGRGICLCEKWHKYENFFEDMHESYIEHLNSYGEKDTTLDRIDYDGNYEPSNCRWATRKEQANNKRNNKFIKYKDEIHTIAEWSAIKNIPRKTLEYRIRNGWNEECLFAPLNSIKNNKKVG